MKLRRMMFWMATAAAAMFPSLLHAGEGKAIEAKAAITAVTVYEDRALVTRRAELALEPGRHEVVFRGLPASLDESSLRAAGAGAAKAVILGIEASREYLPEAGDARVKALEKEIEELEEKALALDDQGKTLGMQLGFVESIKSSTGEGISKEMLLREPRPAEWEKVVRFLGAAGGAISPKLRETQRSAREVRKEIEAAKKKLAQVLPTIPREQVNVTVALDAARGGGFALDLSVSIPGACWTPFYDARADREKGTVELAYCGEVRQNTGEDWKDVALSLSTAKPSIGGRPPELQPWYIGFSRPRLFARKAKGALMAAAPAAESAMAPEEAGGIGGPEEEAGVAVAEVERRGEAVTFAVKAKATIPSDNNLHKTTIASFAMKATYEYLCVPKLAECAFLAAKVKNEAQYPLLAGRAAVFMGPEYIGGSELKYAAPGEQFDLFLGVDEGVRVRRKLLTTEAERSTVRWRTGWREYQYRIECENLKPRNETVVVLDQLPVSREPDIAVKLGKASPETVRISEWEKPGALCWRLELAPGEKKTIEFGFSVSFPKGKEIAGLE